MNIVKFAFAFLLLAGCTTPAQSSLDKFKAHMESCKICSTPPDKDGPPAFCEVGFELLQQALREESLKPGN